MLSSWRINIEYQCAFNQIQYVQPSSQHAEIAYVQGRLKYAEISQIELISALTYVNYRA